MPDYFIVRESRGPAWDASRPRREQDAWDEHAAYVDALSEEGVVVLAGPVGEDPDHDVVLVMRAASEEAVRERLAADPWTDVVLSVAAIEPWSVWVRSPSL